MLVVYLIALLIVLVFLHVRRCQKYWKNLGVASTSPKSPFGDSIDFILGKKTVFSIFKDIYEQFPNERYVGFYELYKPNLLVRDPQLIEFILVKDFSVFTDRFWIDTGKHERMAKHLFAMRGKQWKDLRSKLITTFSTNKLKLMVSSMERCAQIMDSLVKEKCGEGAVEVQELVSRFATDVIGCCVFGLQFNTLMEPESEYREIGEKLFKPTLKATSISILKMIAPKVAAWLRLRDIPFEIENFFSNLLRLSEDFRKTESFRRNDLMQLMLDIRDRDQEKALHKEYSDEELIDNDVVLSNVLLFYTAGLGTTATTLAFCLYELSLHPDYQRRLREEIRTILETNEDVASYEGLKKMTFMEMVISETLRKYPPVGFLNRICNMPYQLPETSIKLARGDRVTIPVNGLHYDEKYYPNPHKFDPERFTPENIAARPSYTYMPFGDGPRMCIAIRFARLEMKLCLAKIISNYELTPCSKTEIPIQMKTKSFLLSPKNGIHLQVWPLTSVSN